MLLREYAIKRWFVIPPLLTNLHRSYSVLHQCRFLRHSVCMHVCAGVKLRGLFFLFISMKYADRAKRVRDNSFFPKSLEVCLMLGFLHLHVCLSVSTTHAVDIVAAHQCHELWSHTRSAEWQTKWHNHRIYVWWVWLPHVWHYEIWSGASQQFSCVTCTISRHASCLQIKWRHVYITNKTNKLTAYLQRAFSPVSRYVKVIKVHQVFLKLWSQMYCHLFMVHSVLAVWSSSSISRW